METDRRAMPSPTGESSTNPTLRRTARLVFVAFLITFVAALTALFFTLPARSLHHAEERARPRLERLEHEGPL